MELDLEKLLAAQDISAEASRAFTTADDALEAVGREIRIKSGCPDEEILSGLLDGTLEKHIKECQLCQVDVSRIKEFIAVPSGWRRRWKYGRAVAVAAIVVAIAIPLAILPPDKPGPPEVVFRSDAFLSADNMNLRRRAKLVPILLAKDFLGKEDLIRGSLAVNEYEEALDEFVSESLDRLPITGHVMNHRFDEAVQLYGVKVLQKRGFARVKGLIPVNGQRLPPLREENTAKEAVAYFYCQAAVQRLRDLFRQPPSVESSTAPPGAQLLTIEVDTDKDDETRGLIRFSISGPNGENKEPAVEVAFGDSLPPIPLRRYFPRSANPPRNVRIGRGQSPDEIMITFTPSDDGAAGLVSLTAPDPGLAIDGRLFGEKKLVEVCLEALAKFRGKGPAPHVQFLTGGGDDDVFPVGSPPGPLDDKWRRIVLPVELSQAKHWSTGLTITAGPLAAGDELDVYIRDLYIRPLDGRSPSRDKQRPRLTGPSDDRQWPKDELGTRYIVYDDKTLDFQFTGVMPNGKGVAQRVRFEDKPWRGAACYRAMYQLDEHPWVAVAAMLDGVWEPKRKFNMFEKLEAKKGDRIVVRFYARSPDGAVAQFKVGGLDGDSLDFAIGTDWIKLGQEWKMYEIDVTDKPARHADLSALRGAFMWVMDREHNADRERKHAEINLDDIYFTRLRE
jgi:hypothetical protein